MPTHLVSKLNLDLLWPEFVKPWLETLEACEKAGFTYVAYFGYRAPEEQARLYFQGRTTPGHKVTNAPPYLSLHQYGLAVDHYHLPDPKKPKEINWGTTPADQAKYRCLKTEGERRGLQVGVPGVAGGDVGHVQVRLKNERAALLTLKATYMKAKAGDGLKACWALIPSLRA